MSKTKISGKRIAYNSIELEHLKDDIKIPEQYLQLRYSTHGHDNFEALNIITNSSPSLVKNLDLKDVYLAVLDLINGRDKGVSLKESFNRRALKSDMDKVLEELESFKGNNETLADVYNKIMYEIKNTMDSHDGAISHGELDSIYNEIINARGEYKSLSERFDNIKTSGDSGGGNSTTNAKVWTASYTLPKGERIIITPNSYSVGTNGLFVYEGALLLTPGENNDYIEIDENTIRLNYSVDEDVEIKFMGVDYGSVYDWCVRLESNEGQYEFSTMYNYTPNMNQLVVYEDGMLLSPYVDYTVDDYKIIMTEPLPEGCSITIAKRRM